MLDFLKRKNKRIYFDYASATPVLEIAKKTFLETCENFANASSIHAEGEKSKEVLFEARKKIAKFLHVRSQNIYFASSTTEANNIFIKGIMLEAKGRGSAAPHIIYSKSDHSAIVDVVKACKKLGSVATSITPNKIGKFLIDDILSSINEHTKLICFSLVSSELGTIQEARKIVLAVREFCEKNNFEVPKIFVDATQAVKYENLDVSNLLVDGLSFSGSKLGNVPGCAVLYVKNNTILVPIISGGGQEEGVRSGTENLPAIMSLSKVLEEISDEQKQKENREYVYDLRNYTIQKLNEAFVTNLNNTSAIELEIFGDTKFKYNKFFENSAPHILLISLVDMLGEETLLRLDAKGISVSTASACSLLANSGSNFLKSINEPIKAKETIRLSFSEKNTKKEVDTFVKALREIKDRYII